ncbi:MAG: DegT/DnrJ/EryC1/StrS family aminotransferase [Phycisphaerae bacterium]|jgi:dTDP-4-amino-4,6-dideoxygalactose transaminase|nr:DegT/DnrJ/EryC1/StrS family aminotransferase [Phycisphaerae bacterium]
MSKLAINGGTPAVEGKFPPWPIWDETELRAVEDVVRSGEWERRGGGRVDEFERKFAELQHAGFAIACANGSVAIEVVLEALGVGEGDEVIVPGYTFMATAAATARRGAKVVIVDVDPYTFCIDPAAIEAAVTKRTRCIIPVHFGGHPCDMDRIMALAAEHNLDVVEDCAHAHGARWRGRDVGTFGCAGTFSFQASKTLPCGEGGAVVGNDEELMARCRSIHDAGRAVGQSVYDHYLAGTNYRMGEFQAAILLAQMTRLEDQCNRRDTNGRLLTELLTKIDGIKPQSRAEGLTRHGHYLFTFVLEADVSRESFKRALAAEGVPLQLEYPAIHRLDFVRARGEGGISLPVSERLAERSVWLYHEALLGTGNQVRQIADAIKKVLDARDELAKIEL